MKAGDFGQKFCNGTNRKQMHGRTGSIIKCVIYQVAVESRRKQERLKKKFAFDTCFSHR
jgi:hypothetical protein